jgi:hypothetical protein
MKARMRFFERYVFLVLVFTSLLLAKTPPAGDIAPAAKRRPTLELAEKIATVTPSGPLSPELNLPFNPVAFTQPDPEEQRALEQAAANQQASANASGSGQARRGATDREQLAELASQIKPTGSMFVRGEPRLILQSRFVKIGDKFTVTNSGVDYVLELTAIDLSSFTLRLNGELITRPLKSGKKTP